MSLVDEDSDDEEIDDDEEGQRRRGGQGVEGGGAADEGSVQGGDVVCGVWCVVFKGHSLSLRPARPYNI